MYTKSTRIALIAVACMALLAAAGLPIAAQGRSGTTLIADKFAAGYWERHYKYDWSGIKTVLPSQATIMPGQSVVFSYQIEAARTLAQEFDVNGVRGKICVTNDGVKPTENLHIVDQVQYKTGAGPFKNLNDATQTIIPAPLAPGETRCLPYDIAFTPIAGAQYRNTAKITITNHSGHLGVPFGPEPKAGFSIPKLCTIIEEDASVLLEDLLICPAGFTCTPSEVGPWTLIDTSTQSFTVAAHNVTATCGSTFLLANAASLTEFDTNEQHVMQATASLFTGGCPGGTQGCTPGYWKNHTSSWSPTGYAPAQALGTVFTPISPYHTYSLLAALSFAGGPGVQGAQEILYRAAVAALLNASHPEVNYQLTTEEVIIQVNIALASGNRDVILSLAAQLDAYNNVGCPLH